MTVYLIGDSIRQGYEPFLRQYLPELIIAAPKANCRDSHTILENIAEWTADAAVGDVIHINCGLHDIRYNAGCNVPLNDLPAYRQNLTQIFTFLQQSGATVIWASSTPFLEKIHNQTKSSRRYLSDIQRYNQAADELAKSYGFIINDLYGLMFQQDLTALMLYDGLHFNELGNKMLADHLAKILPNV